MSQPHETGVPLTLILFISKGPATHVLKLPLYQKSQGQTTRLCPIIHYTQLQPTTHRPVILIRPHLLLIFTKPLTQPISDPTLFFATPPASHL